MAVTYAKLRQLLIDRGIQWQEMEKYAKVTSPVAAKINKDLYVSIPSLEKICRYLSVEFGDIMELKK